MALPQKVAAALVAPVIAITTVAPATARADEPIPFPALIHIPHYPLTPVAPATTPMPLPGKGTPLNVAYAYKGKQQTLTDFLSRSSTLSYVVLRDGKVVDERYFSGQNASSRFNSWSVGKSITAAALGIALNEGKIHALTDPVTRYVPELKGTGYDGVPIDAVLHMASGVKWDETNYFNITTGATAAQLRVAFGTPMTTVAKEAVNERPPGTKWNYSSQDSFVLAWVVAKATGRTLADYVQEKIWKPAGMQSTLFVGKDWAGNGLGYCCYHVTSRDLARFGLLYLNKGKANGRQVVPAGWVQDSTRVTTPYTRPAAIDQDGWGYGRQWWTGFDGDYSAIGVFGQYVYVSPRNKVVIVKTSQDINSEENFAEVPYAFHAVADAVGKG